MSATIGLLAPTVNPPSKNKMFQYSDRKGDT